jgi:hypothetical protein
MGCPVPTLHRCRKIGPFHHLPAYKFGGSRPYKTLYQPVCLTRTFGCQFLKVHLDGKKIADPRWKHHCTAYTHTHTRKHAHTHLLSPISHLPPTGQLFFLLCISLSPSLFSLFSLPLLTLLFRSHIPAHISQFDLGLGSTIAGVVLLSPSFWRNRSDNSYPEQPFRCRAHSEIFRDHPGLPATSASVSRLCLADCPPHSTNPG